ncbi:4-hydroxy-3-methylbut-2-enyl diphosphate reductase [bacterium]|jgi:(E)-4-hydroxy-3-methyl-but-2-enyl pyrophosphate reductase|nr:4-hydroxy-3-methylbut-2-enyl diphosphate reductase [bacterium]MBT4251159.1 4-hydroxy-3-methylbut-2-enyl diphosphate reductase [bacterium]MBT4598049.1 4-hydroxy-3-methylbut-2-enyl diphosphate reductase [bacterium]MBT6753392.1 4-hydroxy-3-methylbut-2-enyl diphosphate reductase [bacterium]MBT7038105.1 4-hydroxy-3-methylbut-2-enyl diphosphate reductase [bacterium]
MECKVAKTAGFCGGVKKAFLMVQEEFKTKPENGRILIFGSLVHNENVMKIINGMGIVKIDSLNEVGSGDIVIITAHGAGRKVFEEIERRGATSFNATCPKVSMVQDCAKKYYEKGFEIIIFGNREHKEVRGINGWCENKARIIPDFKEVAALINEIRAKKIKKPILLISQTTQNIEKFERIKKMIHAAIKEAGGKIEIIDTICRATFVRQKEAFVIAKEMDAVIVIGGRSSSNTKQLWKIAKDQNPNTIWIEDPSEVKSDENKEFLRRAKSIGIISGASTSPDDINMVRKMIESSD